VTSLASYAECARIGFVNNLAFRLRYYTGIFTYLVNVTVYYFIWQAVYRPGEQIAGYDLGQMITYVAVGWMMRSFYWNTVDQEMAYEVIEGKIAMQLLKPLSVQWAWLSRAAGESAFRLALLTAPTALLIALVFPVHPPASALHFILFLAAVVGSFLLMGAINFIIGTCAIHLESILALIRAKFWLMELLSGVLVPMTFFPAPVRAVLRWLPFEHIAFSPLEIYLGKQGLAGALVVLLKQWLWVGALAWLGAVWWRFSIRKITIHGG
jgi:ABC-2 type transport system permease protein